MTVVNAYKYLGIYFSTRLSFNYACQELICRAKKAVICILQSMYKFENNTDTVFIKLFDTQVQPIVQYGAEIWGFEKGKEIEKLHLFALKRFLHVNNRTPNDIVYGEMGRYPIYVNSLVACIRYWLKLIEMDEHRLPRMAYKMLYDLDCRGKITWASQVRNCLFQYGLIDAWINQGVGCTKSFLCCFKQRVIDRRWQEWNGHVHDSDRFSLYRMFKTNHNIEHYIKMEMSRYVRNALTKFGCGMSIIATHARRYKYNRDADLQCRLCHNACEDELHLVFCCPCLSDLRVDLIPSRYYSYPCTFRLVLLLATQNHQVLHDLAIFLYLSFKRLNIVAS